MAIVKKGSVYHYQFQHNGTTYRGSTKTDDKEQAREVERKARAEVNQTHTTSVSYHGYSIKDALDAHLKRIKGEKEYTSHLRYVKKLGGSKLDTKTKQPVAVHALDIKKDLSALTERDLQLLIDARKSEGNSTATIRYELLVLSQAIKHAKRMGHAIPDIDFADLRKVNKLKPSSGRLRYLTETELKKLFAELYRKDLNGPPAFQQAREDAADFVVCSAYIGTRYGELANLKWSDVDLENGIINLYRPKVKNETRLHMPNAVKEVLAKRKANTTSEYVFTAKDGGPRKNSPRALKSACRRAGLTDVSFHTLRHSLASRLAQNGVPIQAIQNVLGHASVLTTMRYSHLSPSTASLHASAVLNGLAQRMDTE